MAANLKNIVVALHDREAMGDAMDKAAQLEHYTGARVTVVQTCWDVVSEEPTQHFPQEEIDTIASRMKEAELNGLSATIAHFREHIAELEAEVIWSKHHDDAVARFAVEIGADLIIAPHHPHAALQRVLLPEELKLAARASTPLLLTSGSPWQGDVNVLVALDVTGTGHDSLNDELVDVGQALTNSLGGELHLLTVSPSPSASVTPTETLDDFKRASEQRRITALESLAASHPFEYAALHTRTGEVSQVIDDIVNAYGIDVIVIGTAARTGLLRLFVGNTAESILNHITDKDVVMVADPQQD